MPRPTKYSEKILKKAKQYLLSDPEPLPTIEGLCVHLDIHRDTAYRWKSDCDKEEFSDIMEKILTHQAKQLIEKGLTGQFNVGITKMLLEKHGYGVGQTEEVRQPIIFRMIPEEEGL